MDIFLNLAVYMEKQISVISAIKNLIIQVITSNTIKIYMGVYHLNTKTKKHLYAISAQECSLQKTT